MPLTLSIGIQDGIVLAACVIAAILFWRLKKRTRETGCPACRQNPQSIDNTTPSSPQ